MQRTTFADNSRSAYCHIGQSQLRVPCQPYENWPLGGGHSMGLFSNGMVKIAICLEKKLNNELGTGCANERAWKMITLRKERMK